MSRRDMHTALAAYGLVIAGVAGQVLLGGADWPLAAAAVALLILFIMRKP
jgi:hypothetical protein